MFENHMGVSESSSESSISISSSDSNGINSSSSGPYNLHGNSLTLTVVGLVVFILLLLSFHYKRRIRRGARSRLQFAVARGENLGGLRPGALPHAPCKGLDDLALRALPVFSFDPAWAQREGGLRGGNWSESQQCAVCLSPFDGGDEVRLLPRCMHTFHAACIDLWFRSHSDCPLCRQCAHDGDNGNNRNNHNNNNSGKNAMVAEVVVLIIDGSGDSASTTTSTSNDDTAMATASASAPHALARK